MDSARFERLLVHEGATIRDVIEAIDAGAVEIALVVDADRRLLGTVTDGDVRRALLRDVGLDDPAAPIVHREPVSAPLGTATESLLRLMTDRGIEQVPLLDETGRVLDLAFIRDLVRGEPSDSPVVLMAGGEGLRLRPLTETVPKPMLPVGERPLLETVLDQVRLGGFHKVVMAVNYRGDVIEEHFGDGSAHGIEIDYVHEPHALGSAGALQLMRERLDRPFLVMNADLLTKVNLASLMRFHAEEDNLVTVGVRQYRLEVPYGVVELEGTRVTGLREKPQLSFFVNAGIYAVGPDAVALLPEELTAFNMTDLVDAALATGARVGSFPIREFWLDIGQLADYERSADDHATHFAAK